MSDSGFSQFPTKPPPQTGQSLLSLKTGLKAQVLEISGKIARLDAPQTVGGEVTKVNRDGTVQIKTEQGELTIRPRERIVPAEGQKLQIDLPAGAPPRQVTVRPAPTTPPPPHTPASAPSPPSGSGSAAPSPIVPDKTPPTVPTAHTTTPDKIQARPSLDPHVQAHLHQHQAARPPAPLPALSPQTLSENALLRLSALPPAQIKEFLAQDIFFLPTRLTTQPSSQAGLPPQGPPPDMIKTFTLTRKETIETIIRQWNTALRDGNFPAADMPGSRIPSHLQPPEAILRTFNHLPLSPTQVGKSVVQPLPLINISPAAPKEIRPDTIPLFNRITLLPPSLSIPAANPGLFAMPKTNTPMLQPLANSLTPATIRLPQSFDVRIQALHPPVLTLTTPPAASETLAITSPTPAMAPAAVLPQMDQIIRPATAMQMTAQIVGMTAQQTPVITIPLPQGGNIQFFTIPGMVTDLIPGTILTLTPQPGTTATAAVPGTTPGVFELMTGFRWPVFDELIDTQNLQIQTAATQTLAQILPSPAQPAKLPAAALLFIAAVRAGDLQAWLGDKAVEHLRRSGKAEWVARMSREFSGLNKLVSEPVNAEWRGMSIPLYAQGQIDKIHLYYRSGDQGADRDQEKKDKTGSTRFIFDLNLSAIGPVQLDGYVRGKVLDLAVRTEQPFSAAMRHDMTRRYIHVLESAGLEGALIFQSHPDKWVHITPRADILSTSI